MNKQHLVVVSMIATIMYSTAFATSIQSSNAVINFLPNRQAAAPIAISDDNTYIAWWTNKTGNDEVMFRASTDGGTTFTDKINLSNSTDAESQDVEIAADGDYVIISWWERNQTSEEPVVRVSTDAGATFGPLLKLANNGTIGSG